MEDESSHQCSVLQVNLFNKANKCTDVKGTKVKSSKVKSSKTKLEEISTNEYKEPAELADLCYFGMLLTHRDSDWSYYEDSEVDMSISAPVVKPSCNDVSSPIILLTSIY